MAQYTIRTFNFEDGLLLPTQFLANGLAKAVQKVFNWSEVHLHLSNFLQNPYFSCTARQINLYPEKRFWVSPSLAQMLTVYLYLYLCRKNWLWCSPRSSFSVLQWETLPGGPSSSLDRCGDGCQTGGRPHPRTDHRGSDRAAYPRCQTSPRNAFYNWHYCHHSCNNWYLL